MSKVRIAYIAHYTGGGSALSLQALLNHLNREQFEPVVLFHRVKNPSLVEELAASGIEVRVLTSPLPTAGIERGSPLTGLRQWVGRDGRLTSLRLLSRSVRNVIRYDRRWLRPLDRALRELAPHIVHCNNGLSRHRADLWLCHRLGIPTICHVRNFERLSALEQLTARWVWRFVYISEAVAGEHQRQGIPPEQGVIVPNAVPLPAELSPEAMYGLRATLGCAPGHFVVAHVGRLVRWKGQDVFLQAITKLREELPTLRAWVIGEADANEDSQAYAHSLRELASSREIADRVVFTGYREDALDLMAAADVVVHSSVKPEPFGRVIIEGMAAGRPVIASQTGGGKEIVEEGVTGLLVPPGDPEVLASAIRALAGQPERRARMGKEAHRRAGQRFCIEHHVSRLESLYDACLKVKSYAKHLQLV